ncbi:MAG: DMT family transporter, partial [Clostridia bacterium]|nr:DMT family transporter [Clostridia bacterium]
QLAATGGFRDLFRQGKATVILVIIGVFGFLLDLFANLGYANGGSLGTGTALLKTDVLMVNLLTVAILRKRLYATDWIGTLLMLAGVLLVLGLDFRELTFRPTDLFFIASAACVTANAFIIKAAQDKHGQKADTISYYNNFVVLLLFALFAVSRGDLAALSSTETPGFWWFVALGGLAQTGIYFFYYRNLRRHEVWTVKLWLLLMPVLSSIVGVLFLNEQPTAWKLVGIGVVLIGAMIILLREKLHPEKREDA